MISPLLSLLTPKIAGQTHSGAAASRAVCIAFNDRRPTPNHPSATLKHPRKNHGKSAQVSALSAALATFIADVNTKLAGLEAQIASLTSAPASLSPEDQAALSSLLTQVQSADASLTPAPAAPAAA